MKVPSYLIKILYIVISIILSCGIIAVLISIAPPISASVSKKTFFLSPGRMDTIIFFYVGIYLFFVSLVLSLSILWACPQTKQ